MRCSCYHHINITIPIIENANVVEYENQVKSNHGETNSTKTYYREMGKKRIIVINFHFPPSN